MMSLYPRQQAHAPWIDLVYRRNEMVYTILRMKVDHFLTHHHHRPIIAWASVHVLVCHERHGDSET
jgi:hypothetical protein